MWARCRVPFPDRNLRLPIWCRYNNVKPKSDDAHHIPRRSIHSTATPTTLTATSPSNSMAASSRMDRFVTMIGGENALPPKVPTPNGKQEEVDIPQPREAPLHHTDDDSHENQHLPNANSTYRLGEIEAALSQVKQESASSSSSSSSSNAFSSDRKAPFDARKGEHLPSNVELTPFFAVTKYCYTCVPYRWSQSLATAFFDAGKIYTRDWSLYYIYDDEYGLLTFVPTSQVQSLFDEINAKFERANVAIDQWQRENGFVLTFDELPKALRPRFLGQCISRSQYASWRDQLSCERLVRLPTAPTTEDPSIEAVRAKIKVAYLLNTEMQKASRKKRHSETSVTQGDSASNAMQYFGLNPTSDSASVQPGVPEPLLDHTKPVPHAFDQEPILIAIDVEAYEHPPRMITEIGVATLDTRDLKGIAPGENGREWQKFIRGRHLRIAEYKRYKNRRWVKGCPDAFEFGTSEFVPKKNTAAHLSSCFREPYSGGQNANHPSSTTTNGNNNPTSVWPEHRNLIIVGHDLSQDIKYFESMNVEIRNRRNLIDTLDTIPLFKHYTGDSQASSLGKILLHFDLESWNLHNAGNDAVYTMHALLAICVTSAGERRGLRWTGNGED